MKIFETFTSIQGEGHLAGKLMFFARTQGCLVKCPIRDVCDEPRGLAFDGGEDVTAGELTKLALAAVGRGGWVCLTGGEPAEQDDFQEVCGELRRAGLLLNIQTSGTLRINAQWDWLTVSPKTSPARLSQKYGNELKIIYQGQSDVQLIEFFNATRFWNYYLQPLWSDGGAANTVETIETVKRLAARGTPYELSVQLHKYLGIQ